MFSYRRFKIDITEMVAECYVVDESSEGINTSPTAIVFQEPNDDEELVGIQYDSGEMDYVPQDILDVCEPDMDMVDMIINMKLDSGVDYVRIYVSDFGHGEKEIVYWDAKEWDEDETVLDSIMYAIDLFHTDKELLINSLK